MDNFRLQHHEIPLDPQMYTKTHLYKTYSPKKAQPCKKNRCLLFTKMKLA